MSTRSHRLRVMTVIDVTEADFDAEVIERSAHDARRRRLLGRLVRSVPRARRRCSRRPPPRARARSCWRRSTPTPTRGWRRRSASRASRPSRRSATARSSRSSSARSRARRCERFFDALVPSEAELLAAAGDEAVAARRARARAGPRRRRRSPLARILIARGELDEARGGARAGRATTSRPTACARGSGSPRPASYADALAALDAGEDERAFELLLAALPDDDVRQADRRRARPPRRRPTRWSRETRRRLAAALY